MDGRGIRLGRLFGEGKAVIVAIDHGMFDGPIPGMEELPVTVQKINDNVDGILLAPGMLRRCATRFAGRKRPLAVVRLNWNTVYCFKWDYRQAQSVAAYQPEDALREGMDIALVSLTLRTGDEVRDAENVRVFCELTTRCHALGIPVIGEYFPTGHADMPAERLRDDVRDGSRILCELGADAIKTFYTKDFHQTVRGCPVPVLGLGAERLPTQAQALDLAAREVADGAGGVVFGRNAIQVPDPHAFQAALCEVVREGASPEVAAKKHNLRD